MYVGDSLRDELYHVFDGAKHSNPYYLFYQAPSKCADYFEVPRDSVIAFRNFGKPLVYPGEPSLGGLLKFMDDSAWPALVEYTEEWVDKINDGGQRLILFTDERECETKSYHRAFVEAANELEGGSIKFRQSCSKKGVC